MFDFNLVYGFDDSSNTEIEKETKDHTVHRARHFECDPDGFCARDGGHHKGYDKGRGRERMSMITVNGTEMEGNNYHQRRCTVDTNEHTEYETNTKIQENRVHGDWDGVIMNPRRT